MLIKQKGLKSKLMIKTICFICSVTAKTNLINMNLLHCPILYRRRLSHGGLENAGQPAKNKLSGVNAVPVLLFATISRRVPEQLAAVTATL
ncbi:MAG TPA: hypothetical protein DCZ10_05870 [Pelotomaculum sp.]|nr:hypothetical protein [Pelotomaculum sp.]